MKPPPIPNAVFKYFRAERSSILKDLRIRFANPADFNDPYEVSPRFDVTAEKTATQAIEKLVCLDEKLGIPQKDSTKALENFKKQLLPKHVKKHNEQFQKECGEKFRMLCFCANIQSPLMWGHYCDCHTGFALECDTSYPFFKERLAPVFYEENRPHADDPHAGPLIPLIKNREWNYEFEWRIVQPVHTKGHHYETLPAESIKAVYFGLRSSPALRWEIENSLSLPSRAHIKKFEMALNPANYKLNPIPFQSLSTAEKWWLGEGI